MPYPTGFESGDVFESRSDLPTQLGRAQGRWKIAAKMMPLGKNNIDFAPVVAVREEEAGSHPFFHRRRIPLDPASLLAASECEARASKALEVFYYFSPEEVAIVREADLGLSPSQQEALKNDWRVGATLAARCPADACITVVSHILTQREKTPRLLIGLADTEGSHSLLALDVALRPEMTARLNAGYSLARLGLAGCKVLS